ncbi:MAG: thioesterase family protein [Bryobacter sp.]|jgi:predicted thioesterase|nr:thioesterase family protein [Bryobacter sp.]
MAVAIGLEGEQRLLVTGEYAIDFLGHEDARVLGTPWLIALLEWTARNSVKPHLEDGEDTVGTEVNMKHLAATPVGMSVVFRSRVTRVEGRRIWFDIEAFDEKEQIASGTHERFVVNIAKFRERLAQKR